MTATARTTPTGTPLVSPLGAKVAIAADPDISLWEVEVTPPGIDFGEPIDTTTHWNTLLKTFSPQELATTTPCNCTGAYDPAMYDQIVALQGVNGWITVHLPDGSCVNFVGYLRSFTPAAIASGSNTQPRAAFVLQPTNQLNNVEQNIEYSATGTGT
jgi:hypothetical protein